VWKNIRTQIEGNGLTDEAHAETPNRNRTENTLLPMLIAEIDFSSQAPVVGALWETLAENSGTAINGKESAERDRAETTTEFTGIRDELVLAASTESELQIDDRPAVRVTRAAADVSKTHRRAPKMRTTAPEVAALLKRSDDTVGDENDANWLNKNGNDCPAVQFPQGIMRDSAKTSCFPAPAQSFAATALLLRQVLAAAPVPLNENDNKLL